MKAQSVNTKFINKLLFSFCSVMVVSAVAVPFSHAAGSDHGIRVLAGTDVESSRCEYVGDVWGTSGWGKSSLTVWKHKAEHKAMKMAKDLNATHVHWEGPSAGSYGQDPHAYGKAYRCDKSGNIASVNQEGRAASIEQYNW